MAHAGHFTDQTIVWVVGAHAHQNEKKQEQMNALKKLASFIPFLGPPCAVLNPDDCLSQLPFPLILAILERVDRADMFAVAFCSRRLSQLTVGDSRFWLRLIHEDWQHGRFAEKFTPMRKWGYELEWKERFYYFHKVLSGKSELTRAIQCDPSIPCVRLCGNSDDDQLAQLGQALEEPESVVDTLYIEEEVVKNFQGLSRLFGSLARTRATQLAELVVDVNIVAAHVAGVARAVRHLPGLLDFSIQGVIENRPQRFLTTDDARELLGAIQEAPLLDRFSLVGLNDTHALAVSQLLRTSTSLRHLDLVRNTFSDVGVQVIATALEKSELSTLSLSPQEDGALGNGAYQALGRALARSPPNLRRLSVGGSQATAIGMRDLVAGAAESSHLVKLTLGTSSNEWELSAFMPLENSNVSSVILQADEDSLPASFFDYDTATEFMAMLRRRRRRARHPNSDIRALEFVLFDDSEETFESFYQDVHGPYEDSDESDSDDSGPYLCPGCNEWHY